MNTVSDLLNLSPKQLKKMSKQDVHTGYAIILAHMLKGFYIDCSEKEPQVETVEELDQFIATWLSDHIKQPHEEWQPGDTGK